MTHDWLLEDDRADQARDRLINEAAALIRERGIDAFDINELAHRSRATVYRHVGGKKHIVEAVLARSSVHVVDAVTQWAIRGFLSLVLWPMSTDHEHAAVDALVAGLSRITPGLSGQIE